MTDTCLCNKKLILDRSKDRHIRQPQQNGSADSQATLLWVHDYNLLIQSSPEKQSNFHRKNRTARSG